VRPHLPAVVAAVVIDVPIGAAFREKSPWLVADRTQPALHSNQTIKAQAIFGDDDERHLSALTHSAALRR
jgi:hypothetical protein